MSNKPLMSDPVVEERAIAPAAPLPGKPFKFVSDFRPAGDQPQAIEELIEGLVRGERDQVLLGVTGSGKTFTMAHVIQNVQRPALVLAPNKTLAAQLYGEMKSFFPDNAVEYFVSYYDYYQPEAYVPRTDTYIEKESSINEQIDRMRHSATRALLERRDVIIVASVSCIYGIGSLETYSTMTVTLKVGQRIDRNDAAAAAGRAAVQAQRRQFLARHLPRARRYDRALPGASGRPRLAHLAVRRRDRGDPRVRPADRREAGGARRGQDLRQQPLRDAEADAAPGDQADQGRPQGPAGGVRGRGQAAGSAAAGAAHHVRPRDDRGDRLLRRHRELFPLSHRPQAGRAAADPVRIPAGRRAADRRREPRHGAADRRHVPRRLAPQVDAGGVRLPPALLHRQPAAQIRGMGRHAAADGLRLGDARARGRWSAPAASSSSR